MVRQVLDWSAKEAAKDGGNGKQLCDKKFKSLCDTYTSLHGQLLAVNTGKRHKGRRELSIKSICE